MVIFNDTEDLIDLIDLIEKQIVKEDNFHFIKVLINEDRRSFIKCYIKYIFKHNWNNILNNEDNITNILDKLLSSNINVNIWNEIMSSCKLNYRYIIYRKSYDGENSGNFWFTNKKGKYHCMIERYGFYNNGITTIHLLIDNGDIKKLLKINKCNWVNRNVGFIWDKTII